MKVEVRTIRYRYQPRYSGDRQQTYTEWELYIDGVLTTTRQRHPLNDVNQFIKFVKRKYSIDTEIIKLKPETHSLGFKATRM